MENAASEKKWCISIEGGTIVTFSWQGDVQFGQKENHGESIKEPKKKLHGCIRY